MNIHEIFKTRLKYVLKNGGHGYQKDIAEKSGYSPSYIRGLTSGLRNPTIRAVWAIAKAMDISPFYLLGGDNDAVEPSKTCAACRDRRDRSSQGWRN